jgi:hypothetical protein
VASDLAADVRTRIDRLLQSDQVTASAHVRAVIDRMCRLTDWVALSTQLSFDAANGTGGDTGDVLQLYRLLQLERVDPQDAPQLVALQERIARGT